MEKPIHKGESLNAQTIKSNLARPAIFRATTPRRKLFLAVRGGDPLLGVNDDRRQPRALKGNKTWPPIRTGAPAEEGQYRPRRGGLRH